MKKKYSSPETQYCKKKEEEEEKKGSAVLQNRLGEEQCNAK